jgi:hypothetical protein
MPIILVTQEAEIRGIAVQRQAKANSSGDPTSKKKNQNPKRAGEVSEKKAMLDFK